MFVNCTHYTGEVQNESKIYSKTKLIDIFVRQVLTIEEFNIVFVYYECAQRHLLQAKIRLEH